MKRVDLIKTIEALGAVLVRHGAKHDWYTNPTTSISQPVPRHREIKEYVARRIIQMLGNGDQPREGRRPGGSSPSREAGEHE
jgi:mRNA interferase HicA